MLLHYEVNMNKKLIAWALFAVIKLNLNWLNLSKEFSFSAKTGTVLIEPIHGVTANENVDN